MLCNIQTSSARTFWTLLPQSSALTRLRYAPNLDTLTHLEIYQQHPNLLSFTSNINTPNAYPEFQLHAARLLARSVTVDGCRVWQGAVTKDGYGQIMVARVWYQTHLLACLAWLGAPPPNTVRDHLCRNRRCLNPLHLEAVPLTENTRRGLSCNRDKPHCKRGHELSGPGKCPTCQKANQRAWYERKRAA